MPGSSGELSGSSSGSASPSTKSQKPVVVHDEPYKGKNKVYIGPRKIDDPPQATFHYGDGKWVIEFKYIKDGKASERGGEAVKSETNPQDKQNKPTASSKLSGEAVSIGSFVAEML